MLKRSDFRHLERLRVRPGELDARQRVFHLHHLAYIEAALAGYWRAMALPYAQTLAYLAGDLQVSQSRIEHEAAAEHDDLLDVGVRIGRIGHSSLHFDAVVFRGEQALVRGELVQAFVDPLSRHSKPLPQELREALQAFEAGKPMVSVRVGDWAELGPDAAAIRERVFIQEQNIPAEMEWDGADDGCIHAVAYNRFGVALATGRLLEHVPGVAKIGRMAVAQSMRGGRVGREVLDALMQVARERGEREAVLHAQLTAASFYSRAGYVARGPVFDEAGIPHVEMVCTL
jgi:YbgC/YbaW family acyl-CoA thioester hydrolase